jgi:hypothetical protein
MGARLGVRRQADDEPRADGFATAGSAIFQLARAASMTPARSEGKSIDLWGDIHVMDIMHAGDGGRRA